MTEQSLEWHSRYEEVVWVIDHETEGDSDLSPAITALEDSLVVLRSKHALRMKTDPSLEN